MKHVLLVVALTLVGGCASLQSDRQEAAAGASASGLANDNHPWPACWESSLCSRR